MLAARGLNLLAVLSSFISLVIYSTGLNSKFPQIPFSGLDKPWMIIMPCLLLICAVICFAQGTLKSWNNYWKISFFKKHDLSHQNFGCFLHILKLTLKAALNFNNAPHCALGEDIHTLLTSGTENLSFGL